MNKNGVRTPRLALRRRWIWISTRRRAAGVKNGLSPTENDQFPKTGLGQTYPWKCNPKREHLLSYSAAIAAIEAEVTEAAAARRERDDDTQHGSAGSTRPAPVTPPRVGGGGGGGRENYGDSGRLPVALTPPRRGPRRCGGAAAGEGEGPKQQQPQLYLCSCDQLEARWLPNGSSCEKTGFF